MTELLGLAVLANMITHWFDIFGIQDRKNQIVDWFYSKSEKIGLVIGSLLQCSRCLGFWMTLIVTQSLTSAAFVAFIAYLINTAITKIEESYE